MAIVDSLLQLVTVRGAAALVMPAGEVPYLEKQGDATRLSMPVPGKDIVEAILKDVLAPEERARLPVETVYRGRDATFDVRVEAAALVILEATIRLLPGVLGNEGSLAEESFEAGLLEHPQYTRPQTWEGRDIPPLLTSGDHAKVAAWRLQERKRLTAARRPDLGAPIKAGLKESGE